MTTSWPARVGTSWAGAVRQLMGFPIRSAIAIAAVAIGVACIVAVSSLALGLQKSIDSTFHAVDGQILIVRAEPGYDAIMLGRNRPLDSRDLRHVQSRWPSRTVVPFTRFGGFNHDIRLGGRRGRAAIYGTTYSYFSLGQFRVVAGGLPSREWRPGGRACAVGRSVFDGMDELSLIGRTINAAGQSCRVIAVVRGTGSAFGLDANRVVILPPGRVESLDPSGRELDMEIHLSLPSSVDAETAARGLSKSLQAARLGPPGKEDFIVVTEQRVRSYLDSMLRMVRLGMLGVVTIILLVSAIGIGNVMLSGIHARRSEIAIKRALGATRRDIRVDFLLEAVVLTASGGLAGIGLGLMLSYGLTGFTDYFGEPTVSVPGCVAGLLVSILVGLITGVVPAIKAAALDPVQALHSS